MTEATRGHSPLPIGTICVWPSSNPIPVGWAICDGAGGTRPLAGKAILGAGGSYTVGDASTGPLPTALGSHSHLAGYRTGGAHQADGSNGHIHDGAAGPSSEASSAVAKFGAGSDTRYSFLAGVPDTHTHNVQPLLGGNLTSWKEVGAHTHAESGESASADSGVSVVVTSPWIALYWIQRLS